MRSQRSWSKVAIMLGMMLAIMMPNVEAHAFVAVVSINGKEMPEDQCIRPLWKDDNSPVVDPMSEDLLCRTKNMDPSATKMCAVAAGSVVKVLFTESGKGSRAISPSHRGPSLAYMSPMATNGKGNVWFKIYEDGYDKATGKWGVERVIANNGYLDITIPADLKPGDYILRPELIGLHEADREFGADSKSGAQYYPSCVQLTVTGTGTSVPQGVAIPGLYKPNDPGITYNLWDGKPYVIPGPPLYKGGGGSAGVVPPMNPPVDNTLPTKVCTKNKAKRRRNHRGNKKRRVEM